MKAEIKVPKGWRLADGNIKEGDRKINLCVFLKNLEWEEIRELSWGVAVERYQGIVIRRVKKGRQK